MNKIEGVVILWKIIKEKIAKEKKNLTRFRIISKYLYNYN